MIDELKKVNHPASLINIGTDWRENPNVECVGKAPGSLGTE